LSEKTGVEGMPGKTKIIAYIIALTAITIIVLQTLYRSFYDTYPWSVDAFHTVKYKASLGFIHPDSLTFWILLTGLILALVVLYFHPIEREPGEMVGQ
jgi:hypothetical protein